MLIVIVGRFHPAIEQPVAYRVCDREIPVIACCHFGEFALEIKQVVQKVAFDFPGAESRTDISIHEGGSVPSDLHVPHLGRLHAIESSGVGLLH